MTMTHENIRSVFQKTSSETIVSQIKAFASISPSKISCVSEYKQKSYSELIHDSQNVAYILSKAGIQKGDLVFVRLHSSVDIPSIYLGILLLGAIFTPVNPSWPNARLKSILSTYNPKAVIVDEDLNVDLPEIKLFMRSDLVNGNAEIKSFPAISIDDPMYGFFTSGTTGIPKCAMNCHRGIKNRFNFMTRVFEPICGKDNVVLQNSNLSFDSSIWQILWPLTQGNTVVFRSGSALADFDKLIELVYQTGVKMTDFVPTIFHQFVKYIENHPHKVEKIKSLRALLIGGESIEPDLVWKFKSLLPKLEVFNTYGPTECSIGMMFHRVSEHDRHYIPIGSPIDNTQAIIVNSSGEAVAPPERGEIVIGGECMGLGYLGNPSKTSEVFKKNTYKQINGERVYFTGDIGFQSEDGLFHFVGRKDEQVKVNGVRLELSEIESELKKLSTVIRAKAVTFELLGVNKIACFIVTSGDLSLSEIRKHLEKNIPRELLPSQIQFLESFPQNGNGKIDVNALKRLVKYFDKDDFQSDSIESQIALLIAEATGIEVTAFDHDLFDLGATSLDVFLVCSQVKRYFGMDVHPSILLKSFTVSTIKDFIKNKELSQALSQNSEIEIIEKDIKWFKETIYDDISNRSQSKTKIFCTGSTGYVGIHLLSWILNNSDKEIFCLVRNESFLDLNSFKEVFDYYEQSISHDSLSRIIPILGDIQKPMFGIDSSMWNNLSNEVEIIYALGAKVNLFSDYCQIRCSNVLSIQETIRLAIACNCPIKYLSTTSINQFIDKHGENWKPSVLQNTSLTGYDKTKLVSEKLLSEFSLSGGIVSIMRAGDIVPKKGSQSQNVNSMLNYMSILCSEINAIPNFSFMLDIIPINIVIQSIVEDDPSLIRRCEPCTFVEYFRQHLGEEIPVVSPANFYTTLKQRPSLGKESSLMSSFLLSSQYQTLEEAILSALGRSCKN